MTDHAEPGGGVIPAEPNWPEARHLPAAACGESKPLAVRKRQRPHWIALASRRVEASSLRNRIVTLADSIPALVSFIDRNECYQYVNAGYEHWFGQPRERYVGQSMRKMLGEPAYADSLQWPSAPT